MTNIGVAKREKKQGRVAAYLERNRATDDNYLLKRDVSRIAVGIFTTVLLFGLCFLIVQPLLHQFSNSIMSRNDLLDPTVIAIPREPTTDHYRLAANLMNYWPNFGAMVDGGFTPDVDTSTFGGILTAPFQLWEYMTGYFGSLLNTIWITALVSVLQIVACTLVAYGFARFDFPLKKFWFACVILTVLVPPQVIRVPMFLNFRFFDFFGLLSIFGEPLMLTGTLSGYLLLSVTAMGLRNGLYIFMLRQYFRNMPKELEESAWVDGCGKLKTFVKIMLPDAVPMLVSCFLFAFVWQWTDGFFTSMFLRGYGVMAVQMSALGETFAFHHIQQVAAATGTHGLRPDLALIEAMISTGVLIGIVPIILIYLVAQRFFVESIGQSGIKM
ncbi:MAG: carbohydrate ABC transporter permease [Defluviitaleaceae bacterium]|nr:carbohydrate ABC transporter permease [Defluviitaleaceae bacterium]MCL2263511.1 carbohydrate ABC transporter permease [Defluviitaleaceae bacterium]